MCNHKWCNQICNKKWLNQICNYAITNYVINKKIHNKFMFPNTPSQLLLDVSYLFKAFLYLILYNQIQGLGLASIFFFFSITRLSSWCIKSGLILDLLTTDITGKTNGGLIISEIFISDMSMSMPCPTMPTSGNLTYFLWSMARTRWVVFGWFWTNVWERSSITKARFYIFWTLHP